MSSSYEQQVNFQVSTMAASIVNSDILLKKIFMDAPDQTNNPSYTFAPNDPQDAEAMRKLKWVRIRTTSSSNEDLIGSQPEYIRMLSVNVYNGRQCFLIQKRLQEGGRIILTNEGHIAAEGDGFFEPSPTTEGIANIEMLNPTATPPTSTTWNSLSNIISTKNMSSASVTSSYFGAGKSFPSSARCVFSQNLKWILYALPGYKYSYVNGQPSNDVLNEQGVPQGTTLTVNETNKSLIRDVLDNSYPQKYPQLYSAASPGPYEDLPKISQEGECGVYVLLYNPIHGKKFRDFYRTLLYGSSSPVSEPNLVSLPASYTNYHNLHNIPFTPQGSTTSTSFNKVMRKYCNAFIVKNGTILGTAEAYSYADPSCAVIFTGQDNYDPNSSVVIDSSFYTRVGNLKAKNYTKNTWKFKYYALNGNPATDVDDSTNFNAFYANAAQNPIMNMNTIGKTVCNLTTSATPSKWLEEQAFLVGQASGSASPSYLETFYNEVKAAADVAEVDSPAPSSTLYSLSCKAIAQVVVDCHNETSAVTGNIIYNNTDITQACTANVFFGNDGKVTATVAGDDSENEVAASFGADVNKEVITDASGTLPGGSKVAVDPNAFGPPVYGLDDNQNVIGDGPVLSFILTLTTTRSTSFPASNSFKNLLAQKLAIETGLAPEQFWIIISSGSIIAKIDVFTTDPNYVPLPAALMKDNYGNTVTPMTPAELKTFFTTLSQQGMLTRSNSDGLGHFLDVNGYTIHSVVESPDIFATQVEADSGNKIYIILIAIAIFIILVYGYLRFRKIL